MKAEWKFTLHWWTHSIDGKRNSILWKATKIIKAHSMDEAIILFREETAHLPDIHIEAIENFYDDADDW